jgi:hypothetical protein
MFSVDKGLLRSRPFFIGDRICLFVSNCVQNLTKLLRDPFVIGAGHMSIRVHGQSRITVSQALLPNFHGHGEPVHGAGIRVAEDVETAFLSRIVIILQNVQF